ncbi:MAG: AAA family ATPase, partial [Actinomycetota bacterium]
MKIAFLGKGGSGKSTIAGNLCRVLAERGEQILAIDTDSVPGLAYSLGVDAPDPEAMSSGAIFVPKKGWEMVVTPREAVEHYAVKGPRGIHFMQFRKVTTKNNRELQASVIVLYNVIKEFERKGWSVVIDLAAGVRQAYTGWGGGKMTFLLVVEPSLKSFFVARRAVKLMDKRKRSQVLGVANKVASPRHRRMIAAELERL